MTSLVVGQESICRHNMMQGEGDPGLEPGDTLYMSNKLLLGQTHWKRKRTSLRYKQGYFLHRKMSAGASCTAAVISYS